jgi:predicted DNA-binding ribbon-helix-helix protein
MKSSVIKRSVVVDGRKTSISIEESFWIGLKELAHAKQMTLSGILASIKADRAQGSNLSSAIRVFILSQFQAMVRAATRIGDAPSLTQHAGDPAGVGSEVGRYAPGQPR